MNLIISIVLGLYNQKNILINKLEMKQIFDINYIKLLKRNLIKQNMRMLFININISNTKYQYL